MAFVRYPLEWPSSTERWTAPSASPSTAEQRAHEVLQHVVTLVAPLWDQEHLCRDLREDLV